MNPDRTPARVPRETADPAGRSMDAIYDEAAETALLGAALLQPNTVIAAAVRDVLPSDFYKPQHQAVWTVLVSLWKAGEPVDVVTVSDRLRRDGLLDLVGGTEKLLLLQTSTPSISTHARYARLVADRAVARRVIAAASEITEAAWGGQTWDSTELLDRAKSTLSAIAPARPALPPDLRTVEDYMLGVEANPRPWVVPDLLKRRWRAMLVAAEGAGKAVLLRQIAICIAQGMHPFAPSVAIEPQRTLYFDLENPPEAIDLQLRLSRRVIERRLGRWLPDQAYILAREGGMNLRTRAGQAEFEAVVDATRPALIVIGPIYKAFRRMGNEDYSAAALAAQEFIDDVRVRFDCAVLLEAHPPKGGAGTRDLDPEGSAVWMHWPEFGLTLVPSGPKEDRRSVMKLGRFRGDRLPASWPVKISRATHPDYELPWTGTWDDGGAPGPGARSAGPQAPPPPSDADYRPAPDEPF